MDQPRSPGERASKSTCVVTQDVEYFFDSATGGYTHPHPSGASPPALSPPTLKSKQQRENQSYIGILVILFSCWRTDHEPPDCNLFRALVWGKTLIVSMGVEKVQGSKSSLGSVKADAVSLSLWKSSGNLSVVFWGREKGEKKHVELECRNKMIEWDEESQC